MHILSILHKVRVQYISEIDLIVVFNNMQKFDCLLQVIRLIAFEKEF